MRQIYKIGSREPLLLWEGVNRPNTETMKIIQFSEQEENRVGSTRINAFGECSISCLVELGIPWVCPRGTSRGEIIQNNSFFDLNYKII